MPEVASVATMSKQQSEDHSIAESKGSGTRLLQRYESEDNSAALLSEQHQVQQHEQQLLLQEDEEDHVGSVLERPPEILQISLHRFEGEKVLSRYKAGS